MISPSKSIIFFGDASQETRTALSRILLTQSEDSILSVFLNRVSHVLQEEFIRLSPVARNGIPSLRDLHCLGRQSDDKQPPHPALQAAQLVLVQLAHFIAAYERHPEEPFPTATSSIVVGLCLGELSATAVSLAQSLTELLPLAVETVRVAFRIGLAADSVGSELEQQTLPRKSWSTAFSRESGLAHADVLETTCQQAGILQRNRAYVSALSRNSVTISGPPSTLEILSDHLENDSKLSTKQSRHRIEVHAPYHAPHLYTRSNVKDILDNPTPLSELFHTREWPGQPHALITGADENHHQAFSRRDLLEEVVCDIVARPMNWEIVLERCASHIGSSENSIWVVVPFGPASAARNLASTLNTEGKGDISLNESFGSSTTTSATTTKAPLAVVGMAGKFPSADNHDQLWNILETGLDCHRTVPEDRFDPSTHLHKTAYGCFLDSPGRFDARFFNMSPREAIQTEPGQRLALMTAYEALEMSGYVPNRTPSSQRDRIGTFYGQTVDEYKETNMAQDVDTYFITGSLRAFGPGRINYYFKFGGPATSIDTVCSSSSVALNTACNSIWSNECDTAVAGGMNILHSPDNYNGLSAGHFLSESGGCKTFDETADGYCRAEAVASVVIKRLDAAQADHDNVLGVILGAATNYSADAASITRPHGPTQEALYRRVLDQAGLCPFDIDYVEMHGTGTQAGDAVEMSSVCNVFAPAAPLRPANQPLYVGALKANVGHSEASAGISSLIKALLVFREQKLPPHIGIKGKINHTFPDLEKRNLHIPLKTTEFLSRQSYGGKRRALINNFGASGGNTALILEEPPTCDRSHSAVDSRPLHIINVTAKTTSSIEKNIQNLIEYLQTNPDVSLSDLSYTTTARRIQYPLRASIVASTVPQLKERLSFSLANKDFDAPEKVPNIVFAFTGQGSLYVSLARELFELSSQFRSDLIRFDQISKNHGFPGFLHVIDGTTSCLDDLTPAQTQLSITAAQIGLCRLWASWGVIPDVVIGHSLGEYAALYVSGVLTLSDTLYLVGERATILEVTCKSNTHSMLAIHSSLQHIKEVLGTAFQNLEVACINGPEDIVLSGLVEPVEHTSRQLNSHGIKCSKLAIPFGFHSSQVDPILDPFEKTAQTIKFAKPRIPIISPLLGTVIRDAGVVGPSYLRRHARESVHFCGALQQCKAEGLTNGKSIWLEIGPHPVCLGMIKASIGTNIRGLASLRKKENAWTTICTSLSHLHAWGLDILWKEYHRDFEPGHQLLALPSYAFEQKNYWIEYKNNWHLTKEGIQNSWKVPAVSVENGPATTTVQKLHSEQVTDGMVHMIFETDLADPAMHAVVIGHLVNGAGLCPASVYADIALTIANYVRNRHPMKVQASGMNVISMEIPKPIVVPKTRPDVPQLLYISSHADLENGFVEIEFCTEPPDPTKSDVKAKCVVEYGDADRWLSQWSRTAYLIQKRIEDLERGVQKGTSDKIFRKMVYKLFSAVVDYDVKYQGMHEVLLNSEEFESTAVLKLYNGSDGGTFHCSPFWIDSLVHLAGFVMNANDTIDSHEAVYISSGWGTMKFARAIDPNKTYRVHTKMQPVTKTMVAGDVVIFEGETVVGMIGDLKFQRVPRQVLNHILPSSSPLHNTEKPAPRRALATGSPTKTVTPVPELVYSRPRLIPAQMSAASKALLVIADEVGISPSELSDDSKFSDLGIDSLLSMAILSKLRETLQLDLPTTVFENYLTVRDFLAFLERSTESEDSYSTVTTPLNSGAASPIMAKTSGTVVEDTIAILRSTIAEQIGIEVEELLTADDLSAFGVDSLMSLSILGALRDRAGLSIPPDAVEGKFSMHTIEKALNLQMPTPVELKNLSTHSHTIDKALDIQVQTPVELEKLSTQSTTKAVPPLSVVLQGNSKSASTYLFLFPDGSGSAMSYAKIPSVSPSVCVFGLNSPFLYSPQAFTCTVEQLATTWVTELRQRQPRGPYFLGGWSAGGYYAFEAAKQLLQAGETVGRLILIDSPCRLDYDPMPPPVLEFLARSGVIGVESLPQAMRQHFESTIKKIAQYQPVALSPALVPKTAIIWASHGVADKVDTVTKGLNFDNGITRFLLNRRMKFGSDGWDRLLSREAIEVASMPGHHFNIVQSPNVESLSRLIADAVQSNPSKRGGDWRRA